jgi:hypothetical protein
MAALTWVIIESRAARSLSPKDTTWLRRSHTSR